MDLHFQGKYGGPYRYAEGYIPMIAFADATLEL